MTRAGAHLYLQLMTTIFHQTRYDLGMICEGLCIKCAVALLYLQLMTSVGFSQTSARMQNGQVLPLLVQASD